MFGGVGIYAKDVMFALVAYGEMYLKVDEETKPVFESAGSAPFVYAEKGGRPVMSYWSLPADAHDDPDEAARWGRLALSAARRSAAAKPKRSAEKKPA